MIRLFTLLYFSLLCLEPVSAQEAYKQAESFNRLAKDAFTRIEKKMEKDSVNFFKTVVDGVEYSLNSDEFDRKPNREGKIELRFDGQNKSRLALLHPLLIDAGKYFSKNSRTRQEGLAAFKLYLKVRQSELVKDNVDESGVAAYYLSYYYLKNRDLQEADKYADIAMIMKFYQNPTPRFNLEDFVDKILEDNTANSVVPWILKGEIAMHAERWDEAIDAYKQADEIDPSSIPVAFNIGVCLNTKGLALRDSIIEKKKRGEVVSDKNFLDIFAEARSYLERVRAKDPRRNKVDWVEPLYLDYTILNDKIKADELEPLVTKYKK